MPAASIPIVTPWRTVRIAWRLGPLVRVRQVRKRGFVRYPWDACWTRTETRRAWLWAV